MLITVGCAVAALGWILLPVSHVTSRVIHGRHSPRGFRVYW